MIPELLPAVDFAGADSSIRFFDWSPRVGVTYDLTNDGRTVLKAQLRAATGAPAFPPPRR